ncbi:hypothetical protein LTR37_017432 [Vermiconidia calcicola]|uniref:Uncharacterized protein n=1 Tax=Vermiconidia calcicola TaxID=1690605 RepID=A0ACC3MK27_9PEZI|nr:hypothetical protein LTR37_017432 [Vermiconidia calcicola]
MDPNTPPKRARAGLPKPDLRRPGQWLQMTRDTHPEAFKTPEEVAESQAAVSKFIGRTAANPLVPGARTTGTAPAGDDEESVYDQTASEGGDDTGSEYTPSGTQRKRASRTGPAAMQQQSEGEDSEEEGELDPADYEDEDEASENGQGAAPADAKQVNDPTWKINQPRTQPLAYWVPSDASGGEIWKSIQFTVDFTSRASVNKANKARRLSIWRAKNILGLHDQMKRPSTKGREYTDQNYQWILAEHAQHAAINNNERIPLDNLTTRYNQRFPTENRTTASLTSYIDRKSGLNAARKTYDSRQR